ncbi:MAG: TonB-dependent receptor [Sphingomonas sp.]|uniref:TonB-dependent receptor domain-containing protein n=1 Tax=Sphingomonas sp. TaxID=28214 RepID=UPI0017CC60DE|nr:TonB-dependent receptor [Sphingomonas sp.]MBA3666286.1 TonB-dependent receptor [Sphingomonas sp.]
MISFRTHILATTVLAGISLSAVPAFAQAAPTAVPDQSQPADPAAAPPAGPVEANPTPAVSATGEQVAQTADIVVTGSRIPQPNLTSAAPVVTISDQDIKLSGTTRIDDLINQLPSAAAPQGPSLPNPSTGTAEIDLRYLGAKRTLSLVNGRRLTPGDPNQGSTGAADVNIIPASLVKRVEILTGGASSVYGADAVAGVVNFIMDTEFEGLRFDGQISTYQHNNNCPSIGGGRSVCDELDRNTNVLHRVNYDYPKGSVWDGRAIDATVSLGAGFDDGRGHVVGYVGYRKQNAALQGNRDYSACTLNDVRKKGGIIPAAINPQCGGSSFSAEGNFLLFVPDTNAAGGTSTFYTRGGNGDIVNGRTRYNFAPLNHWVRPDERYTAGVFANYEIMPQIKPYLEFMFMDDKTNAQIAPSGNFGNTFTINCDNPYMTAATRAIVCSPTNLINGNLGSYPLTRTTNPGAPPQTFIDAQGKPYQQGFFQIFRRNVEGGPRIGNFSHTSYRAIIGTRGDLSNAFSYDAYYQYGRTKYLQVFEGEQSAVRLARSVNVVNDPRAGSPTFGQPVCRSVLDGSDPGCAPFNYFGTPSQAAIDYVNVYGVDPGETSEQIANVNLTGQLGELGVATPWASNGFGINVGWEYRREQLSLTPDQEFITGDLTGQGAPTLPVSGNFHVNEAFAEVQLPIVEHNFIDELTFGAGYRKSWYKTGAGRKYDTDTYKLSAEFAPIADIRFRASYNRASRAPNILELFTQPHVALDGSNDPCAGVTIKATDYGCIAQGLRVGQNTPANPSEQYNGLLGGNVDLLPEKATTKTAGIVLQPRFLPRFAFSVDYWNIDLKDAIQGFGADTVISDCVANSTATTIAPSCSLIRRDGGGSLWLVPAGPGAGYIVDTPTNVGRIKTNGYDFNSSYSRRLGGLGNLSLSFLGTYLKKYKVNNGIAPTYDCAGYYGTVCSGATVASTSAMPKWRHKARATLQMPFGLGVSVNWRHVGKVALETLSDDAALTAPNSADQLNAHVKPQDYIDLAATYTLLDSVNLRAGVNNVFDKTPPIIPSGHGSCPTSACAGNTFPGTWDYMGRFLYAAMTVNFKHRSERPAPVEFAPPPPPPAALETITCPDGLVIVANQVCPTPPPPPAPPPPAPGPERG